MDRTSRSSPRRAASPSSPARRAARAAASPPRSARPAPTVVCTGRSSRVGRRDSDYDRPETIEETAELVDVARRRRRRRRRGPPRRRTRCARWPSGSAGSTAASTCSSTTSGAAEVLKGGPPSGTRRSGSTTSTTGCASSGSAIDTHLITSHHLLPLLVERPGGLLVEVTDGTADYNADALPDLGLLRPGQGGGEPARVLARATSWRRTAPRRSPSRPGWLRSEMMLDNFGVTEENWRDARPTARGRPHRRLRRSPRRRASSAGPSRPSPPIPSGPAGTSGRSPRRSWPASTGSPTSTGSRPTRGKNSRHFSKSVHCFVDTARAALFTHGVTYDSIISNGRWFDGTGAPSAIRNIGIRNGHVVAISADHSTRPAARR